MPDEGYTKNDVGCTKFDFCFYFKTNCRMKRRHEKCVIDHLHISNSILNIYVLIRFDIDRSYFPWKLEKGLLSCRVQWK
jgi:hypothetical protein